MVCYCGIWKFSNSYCIAQNLGSGKLAWAVENLGARKLKWIAVQKHFGGKVLADCQQTS